MASRCRILVLVFAVAVAFAAPGVQAGGDYEFPLLMPHSKPAKEEAYLCTPVRLSDTESFYITGFKPNATSHTAHHMLVYGCEEPGTFEDVWNCGEMAENDGLEVRSPCKTGNQILYAWAMDAPELTLPSNTAFRVAKGSKIQYLVLQVHYAHIDTIPSAGDDSGVFLEYTNIPQPHSAGVLLLGTSGYAPAHSTTFFETACDISDARTIHPFAFRTHTHKLGQVVSGWKVANNKTWSLIGKKNPQDPQMFYPVEDASLTFTKGDTVAARCTMVNDRNRITYIGMTNEDEMCNFYIMYWVKGKEPVRDNTCFSPGPPQWSWKSNTPLQKIPDLAASTL